jgi:hypothetical protein
MLLQVSSIELSTEAFLALTSRLDTLRSRNSKTVENLFQVSLNLAPTEFDLRYRKDKLQAAVDHLQRRVTRLDGAVGEWTRREVRRAVFE